MKEDTQATETGKTTEVAGLNERLVMWLLMPVKIPIAVVLLFLLPFMAAIDYANCINDDKRYSAFVIASFKGLVRFLAT